MTRETTPEPSCFLAQSIVLEAYFVYGLYQAGRLFYVGRTNMPHLRLAQHRTQGTAGVQARFRAGGVTMRVLSVWLTDGPARRAEQALIRRLRAEGHELLNGERAGYRRTTGDKKAASIRRTLARKRAGV